MTAATCRLVAMRSGDWWEIEVVSGLPDNMLGASQARSLEEVAGVARSVVADLLKSTQTRLRSKWCSRATSRPERAELEAGGYSYLGSGVGGSGECALGRDLDDVGMAVGVG